MKLPEVRVGVLFRPEFFRSSLLHLSSAHNCDDHTLKIREDSVNIFYDKTSCPTGKISVKSASRMGSVEILSLLSCCKLRECKPIHLHNMKFP